MKNIISPQSISPISTVLNFKLIYKAYIFETALLMPLFTLLKGELIIPRHKLMRIISHEQDSQ